MKPNLSFTENTEWKKQREDIWAPLGKSLKADYRKKDVNSIKHFFFTGEQDGVYRIQDVALIVHYPLISFDAWDYTLQCLVRENSVFEQEFYESIGGARVGHSTLEDRLKYFDYFHAEKYSSVVRSRVPLAGGDFVEIEVDIEKLFQMMASYLIQFVCDDMYSFCLERSGYFYSMLEALTDENMHDDGDPEYFLKRFMNQACELKPKIELKNENCQLEFLKGFYQKMETLDLAPRIQELWKEVKKTYGKK